MPRVPHPRFVGTTGHGAARRRHRCNSTGASGEVLDGARSPEARATNTLVIFTSDNGPVVDDGYRDEAVAKLGSHKPAGPLRGGKYSNFEGGTRVPFVVRWPARVKPGDVERRSSPRWTSSPPSPGCSASRWLPATRPDSHDVMAALLGTSPPAARRSSSRRGALSLRQGTWKYIEPNERPAVNSNTNTELGNASVPQLYDLGQRSR